MKRSNLFALLAGAAIATGVTLLFTTEKGKDIRRNISDKLPTEELEKLLDNVKKQISKVEDSLKKAKDNTKDELNKLLKKLKSEKAEIEAAIENAAEEF